MALRNQFLIAEWLGKKADGARRKCMRSSFHLGKGGNKNDGQAMALSNQLILQFYPIYARHLHIANHAIGVMQVVRI